MIVIQTLAAGTAITASARSDQDMNVPKAVRDDRMFKKMRKEVRASRERLELLEG